MKKQIIIPAFVWMCVSVIAQPYQALRDEAMRESEKGDHLKAIALSEKAIQQAENDKNASREDVLSLRSENAGYYFLSEQVEKGKTLFEPLLEEVGNGEKLPMAAINVHQNYGSTLVFLNEYSEALPHLLLVLELGKTHKLKADDRINVLGSAAICYQSLYNFTQAEAMYKESLALCKTENKTQTVTYAFVLSGLGLLYDDMQLPERALEQFALAEKAFKSSGDTVNPQFGVFLSDYGIVLTKAKRYEKALSCTFRSRNLSKSMYGESSSEYVSALNNLGFIYNKMNRVIETEQFYEEAMRLEKTLPYQRLSNYYTTVSNLMDFYNSVGRKAEAQELARQLEDGLKNKDFTDTLKRATFANNLGVFYFGDDYPTSYRFYKEALMYYEAVYGADNARAAEIYVDMGSMLQVHGQYNECATYLNKAAEAYKKLAKEESESDLNTFCNLALILKGVEQPAQGEVYINKALDLVKRYNVNNTSDLENVYIIKAQIAADLSQVKTAMDYFNRYLGLKYSQIEQSFSYMTETEKMQFLEQFEQQIRNFYTTIVSNIDQYPELIKTLLDFRLKTKAFLLNNISRIKQRIHELNDPALNEKFEQMKLKREAIAKLMNFDTNEYPYALAEANELKKEADALEKELSLKVSGMLTAFSTRQVDWQAIQKQLRPDEVAIEIFQSYLLYAKGQGMGTNYTYIIVKAKGDPMFVSIDRKMDWENEVLTLYRSSIDAKKDEPDLYRRLWRQVDDKLVGITTVYISPDGIYNQVNLNTLFNQATKKYLVEEKNIHLLTSLRDLKDLKQAKPVRPENSILVGNPEFDYDLTRLSASSANMSNAVATRGALGFVLSELPGTKQEVEMIKTTLEKNGMHAALFTEINANERAIKQVKNPDVLHLATHGFFLEDPKEEDLAGYAKMEKEYYMNPMMRSGIFFSGANKTYAINTANINTLNEFEDGMLTAYEAMNLNLEGTELVVLSACQTGLGKVKNGEGVYGLQRAFKLAGAKAVIMSLWPVSDEATRDLMISFYDHWTKTGDLYNAFKTAQLEVKQKYPQPYYWGAFVLSGK